MINKHDTPRVLNNNATINGLQLYIPLKFWFSKNPGLALPTNINREIRLHLNTRKLVSVINQNGSSNGSITISETASCNLYVDYFEFSDPADIRRFNKSNANTYLVPIVTSNSYTSNNIILHAIDDKYPVKEIIWTVQQTTVQESASSSSNFTSIDAFSNNNATSFTNKNDYFNYDGLNNGPKENIYNSVSYEGFSTAKLTHNNEDLIDNRNASYFRTFQPMITGHRVPGKHVYCYSFAINAEDYQPSGAKKLSGKDTQLILNNLQATSKIKIHIISYKVFTIQNGNLNFI